MKLRVVNKCGECVYFDKECILNLSKGGIKCMIFKQRKDVLMKQTKKPTRAQYDFLERRKKDTEGVRIIEDTHEHLKYVDKNGVQRVLYKNMN